MLTSHVEILRKGGPLNIQLTGKPYLSHSGDGQQQNHARRGDLDGKKEAIEVCGRGIKIQGRLLRIARISGEKYLFLDDPEPMLDGLRKSGIRIDLFTFIQKLSDTSPKYPYPMEWDNFAALRVSTFDHWWKEQINNKARNAARQAERKGVVIQEAPFDEALVRGIWEVYNETPVRQGKRNAHYGKDIATVYKEEATHLDRSIFIGAFLNKKIIGFIKLVYDESRTQAGLMNIVSMISHRDKAPTNALLAQAVRSCAERGITYLVYSNFAYGKKQRDSLSDFKEHNGFQRIDVPRYYVPLNRIGSVSFCLGLHKKFSDYLPEFLLARVREVRKAWHNRKLQLAREGS